MVIPRFPAAVSPRAASRHSRSSPEGIGWDASIGGSESTQAAAGLRRDHLQPRAGKREDAGTRERIRDEKDTTRKTLIRNEDFRGSEHGGRGRRVPEFTGGLARNGHAPIVPAGCGARAPNGSRGHNDTRLAAEARVPRTREVVPPSAWASGAAVAAAAERKPTSRKSMMRPQHTELSIS